ncbi:unnamed protein product [Miscanthus lutarioriparius]|uniref:Uncharacterized protein n=1 Tax=Miscanthus lutarioriparius TaxID=422564 RepID=A0A811Q5A5_9POAL|nr:unnamed protein product [Miscanthus lutarioriparius]
MKGNAVGVPEGSFLVRDASRVDEELPERFKDAVPLRAPKLKSSLARTLVIGDVVEDGQVHLLDDVGAHDLPHHPHARGRRSRHLPFLFPYRDGEPEPVCGGQREGEQRPGFTRSATGASSAAAGSMGTGTARRCQEFPSGTSSAGGREAAAARGGEKRRADAGAGWWEMGSAATGAMPRRGSATEAGSASGLADTEKKQPCGKEA